MQKHKTSLTIGIPAYNEAGNLFLLIESLLKQNNSSFILEKILIYSDASTDDTEKVIQDMLKNNVYCIAGSVRKGKSYAVDVIIKHTHSDILVIIDADTHIYDSSFINKLIAPIITKGADLTAARIEELPSTTFVGKILAASMKFKKDVFYNYKRGDNVYTCCGRARAFSKKLYSTIKFKYAEQSEDAYSFFYCKTYNYIYHPVTTAKIYYRLPDSLSDHKLQSVRFFTSKKILKKLIHKNILKNEYFLPKSLLIRAFLQNITKRPIILFYFPIVILYKMLSFISIPNNSPWEIALSSKKIWKRRKK